jgi:hypothetical protein
MLQVTIKDKRVSVGDYPDYCPIQREIRMFQLFEVRRGLSVFFLPLASERVAYELKDPETGVLHLLPKKPPLHGVTDRFGWPESVAAYANPGAVERYEAGLELDAAAMNSGGASEVRVLALLERLNATEHWLRQATVRSSSESLIALQVAGFMGAAVAAAIAWSGSLTWFIVLASIGALFLLGAVWSIFRQPSRSGRRLVIDVMRRSIAPLRPTPAEATEALEHARRGGLRIAQALRPIDLVVDMDMPSPAAAAGALHGA